MNELNEFHAEHISSAGGYGSREAFLAEYNLNQNGQQRDDDRGAVAKFFIAPVYMGFKSEQAGKAVYEDREFVSIRVKGQDKTEHVCEVREEDKRRFAFQYQQFKAGQSQAKAGTPIERLQGVSPSAVLLFRQHNIRTIEDLAEVADGHLANLGMGARDLQRQAIAYLSNGKVANDELTKRLDALEADSKAKDATIAEQQALLADATALIRQLQAENGAKPKKA